VHEWHSIVVGLVTGLARVWNPESYGWVTGLGKVRTMDIRGRKKKKKTGFQIMYAVREKA
jgi:hypothetical protein